MAHPYWPLFDLSASTPRLTVRYVDDDLAVRLAAVAARGIHRPDWMPFALPWSAAPSPELERNTLQFYWRCRAETSPDAWKLPLAVIVDGEVVGGSALTAERFGTLRQFETGSWLGLEFQGQGLGKELRIATLTLGFVGLDAEVATTSAWHDNAPSLGVTRALGYDATGERRQVRVDRADRLLLFEMSRSHFEEHVRRDDVTIEGAAVARALLEIP